MKILSDYYPLVWLMILSFTLFLYLIEDGSALGMSILLPCLKKRDQEKVLQSLLPVWDLNQTWLVFSLAGLYGGFAYGFSLIMAHFYVSLLLLVILLVCRGAAVEYALKGNKKQWLMALTIFSFLIIILQGFIMNELLFSLVNLNSNKFAYNVGCVLGIITLILYFVQLGWFYLPQIVNQNNRIIAILLFVMSYAFFIITYKPLWHSLYARPAILLLITTAFLLLATCLYTIIKKLYLTTILLNLFALINILTLEYSTLPNVFPDNTSYLTAAANNHSLGIMIVLSVVMLPIIFVATRKIKCYFQNNPIENSAACFARDAQSQ